MCVVSFLDDFCISSTAPVSWQFGIVSRSWEIHLTKPGKNPVLCLSLSLSVSLCSKLIFEQHSWWLTHLWTWRRLARKVVEKMVPRPWCHKEFLSFFFKKCKVKIICSLWRSEKFLFSTFSVAFSKVEFWVFLAFSQYCPLFVSDHLVTKYACRKYWWLCEEISKSVLCLGLIPGFRENPVWDFLVLGLHL